MGNVLETVGAIAGIGGLSLGVFLLIFRDVIKRNIFPTLTSVEAYKIIRLLLTLTFLVAIIGILAWTNSSKEKPRPTETSPITGTKDNPVIVKSVDFPVAVPKEKRYLSEQIEHFPGVAIYYPSEWIEKEAGTGSPRLSPPLTSIEGKLGLEIEIIIGSAFRAGLEIGAKTTLPKDGSRYPDTLTKEEHLNFIKNGLVEMYGNLESKTFSWQGQRLVSIPIHSDSAPTPDRNISGNGWIVDYSENGTHWRELHFLQEPSEFEINAENFGLVEIRCSAPEINFQSVSSVCDSILSQVAIISSNYFGD